MAPAFCFLSSKERAEQKAKRADGEEIADFTNTGARLFGQRRKRRAQRSHRQPESDEGNEVRNGLRSSNIFQDAEILPGIEQYDVLMKRQSYQKCEAG